MSNRQAYARKLIKPFTGRVTEQDVLNELDAVERLCQGIHPNIIEVFAHGRLNPKNSMYYIDMELCDLTLQEYVKGTITLPTLPDWNAAKEANTIRQLILPIMGHIVNGVIFIHSHDQVHRDLKPSNSIIPKKLPS